MSAPRIAYELFAEAGHATTILIVVLGITVCLGMVWRARRLGDQCGHHRLQHGGGVRQL